MKWPIAVFVMVNFASAWKFHHKSKSQTSRAAPTPASETPEDSTTSSSTPTNTPTTSEEAPVGTVTYTFENSLFTEQTTMVFYGEEGLHTIFLPTGNGFPGAGGAAAAPPIVLTLPTPATQSNAQSGSPDRYSVAAPNQNPLPNNYHGNQPVEPNPAAPNPAATNPAAPVPAAPIPAAPVSAAPLPAAPVPAAPLPVAPVPAAPLPAAPAPTAAIPAGPVPAGPSLAVPNGPHTGSETSTLAVPPSVFTIVSPSAALPTGEPANAPLGANPPQPPAESPPPYGNPVPPVPRIITTSAEDGGANSVGTQGRTFEQPQTGLRVSNNDVKGSGAGASGVPRSANDGSDTSDQPDAPEVATSSGDSNPFSFSSFTMVLSTSSKKKGFLGIGISEPTQTP